MKCAVVCDCSCFLVEGEVYWLRVVSGLLVGEGELEMCRSLMCVGVCC